MNHLNQHKIILYSLLALVIIVTFILTSAILNLVSSGKIGAFIIIFVILNILINFAMFFMVYRTNMTLIEKNATIDELTAIINQKQHKEEQVIVETETHEANIEEWIDAILPKNVQSMDNKQFAEKILANSAKTIEIVQGIFFLKNQESGQFEPIGKYAYFSDQEPKPFIEGETISGQVAKNQKLLNMQSVPENYVDVMSGLGSSAPRHVLIIPLINKDETIGIIELASFKPFDSNVERLFDKLSGVLAKMIYKLK